MVRACIRYVKTFVHGVYLCKSVVILVFKLLLMLSIQISDLRFHDFLVFHQTTVLLQRQHWANRHWLAYGFTDDVQYKFCQLCWQRK